MTYLVSYCQNCSGGLSYGSTFVNFPAITQANFSELRELVRKEVGMPSAMVLAFSKFEELAKEGGK